MSLTDLLFSFKGRINRKPWWLATIAVGLAASVITAVIEIVARSSGHVAVDTVTNQVEPTGLLGLAVLAVGLANMWIGFALSVKRLHDRDRSGWWLVWQLLIIILVVIFIVVAIVVPEEQRPLWYALGGGAGVLAFVISVWLFVQIGFLPGTQGPNRFGPDPLGAMRADAQL
ncbi:DUF805 domain-containing protein [Methyloceanibacter sp.]|uniref:DUF805 domain-containing protein n=1 Tax=Methyloceanibacter sp. TaxID=1965321 RepID=UPI003D6D9553